MLPEVRRYRRLWGRCPLRNVKIFIIGNDAIGDYGISCTSKKCVLLNLGCPILTATWRFNKIGPHDIKAAKLLIKEYE